MAALRSELKGLYNMARSRHIQRRENALMAIRKHNYTQVKFEPCSVYSQTRDWFDMREARLWLDYQAALGNNSFRYGRGGRGQPPKLPSR